jgi:hypothetical protein
VGALKQAEVGVALLSGFGDLNVSRDGKGADEKKKAIEDKAKKQGVVAGQAPPKAPVMTSMISQKDIDVSVASCAYSVCVCV